MRARIAASVVLAAGLLLGTSGCAFFSPQSTLLHYDPSDGVGTSVGSVDVRNAFLLTQDGERASMLINFINDGTSAVDLTVQYTLKPGGKTTTTIHLKPGQVKTFGKTETDQFILQGIDKKPGQLYAVWFQYGDHTGSQLLLPILDGTWSQYKGLLPTDAPTPTPTATNPLATASPITVTPPPVTATPTP
ncbi:MAG: hypothetical protein JWN80_3035 [Microbacteriaceae bacterium]|nr:hypothetical protein [Microbacteriaceae bacterium]